MNIKIYQINTDRDTANRKFFPLDVKSGNEEVLNVDASIYDEVFSGEIDCSNLEGVNAKFNDNCHPLHRGHSLSVSDVVVTEKGAFYCQDLGFQQVSFDESQTQKSSNLLRVVYVEPGKPAYEAEVGNNLRYIQKAVGGLFDTVRLDPKTVIVCNDEGKLNGMQGNRRLDNGTVLAGPFFIVGKKGENFASLSDQQVSAYLDKFAQTHEITQAEVEADTYFILIGM